MEKKLFEPRQHWRPTRCSALNQPSLVYFRVEISNAGLQPGQFSSLGGAAKSYSSLDVDDVARETDQDWGEGGASFPADRLPDGGSGSAEGVVPDDFGTDWAAEIGSCDVRIKADHGKTTVNTEAVSSHGVEKRAKSHKSHRNTFPAELYTH